VKKNSDIEDLEKIDLAQEAWEREMFKTPFRLWHPS